MNEKEIIAEIAAITKPTASLTNAPSSDLYGLIQGIGDDCAVIRRDGNNVLLLSKDTLVESVHFDLSWHGAKLLGRKTVSVNVSDIAAMGGKPLFLLLSLGLPRTFAPQWLRDFAAGIAEACQDYGCQLIGGDTVASPHHAQFTITVIGAAREQEVVWRHGAQDGDDIWVSGELGHAAAGLALLQAGYTDKQYEPLYEAHRNPQARVALGQALAQAGILHSMMDVSDGISTDLAHICRRSQVGAVLFAEQIRPSLPLQKAAEELGQDPLSLMLSGGEDYELLFTAPPEHAQQIISIATSCLLPIHRVGRIDHGQGVRMLLTRETGEVREENISDQGFDHFTS